MKHIGILLLLIAGVQSSLLSQTVPSAEQVLQEACGIAKKEKKKVFIIFHASWCGWCHKMDTTMNLPSVKSYFNDHYVIRHLTVAESADKKQFENPGAEELFKKYSEGKSGIPFWIIFDTEGMYLADSKMRNGANSGCPATREEVEHFINVLAQTSTLDKNALDIIKSEFRKNEN